MKKIYAIFIIFTIMNCIFPFTASCTDRTISTGETVNILIPYEDNHVMTRKECMTAINRMIGISDKTVLAFCCYYPTHHEPATDIEYNTYYGRFADLGLQIYAKGIWSTYIGKFFGDESATNQDVLRWMISCLEYKKETNEYDVLDKAIEEGIIKNKETFLMDELISAKDFKVISERFLNCTARVYFEDYTGDNRVEFERISYKRISESDNKRYIDVFNETYRDKVIKISGDDIYLGKNKLDNSNNSFFIDENGVMMMSVRSLAEIFDFNKEIIWEESTQTVNLKNNVGLNMFFEVNSDVCRFSPNAGDFRFGNPAQIINDTMYIPMRAVCEGLTYDVIWCN